MAMEKTSINNSSSQYRNFLIVKLKLSNTMRDYFAIYFFISTF